jgi:hypothetical protein
MGLYPHTASLPVFSDHLIEEVPPEGGYGPVEKERLHDLIGAVALLWSGGVREVGVIGAYHARRAAPLLMRTFRSMR